MTDSNNDVEQEPGHADVRGSTFGEIPASIGPSDSSPMKQVSEITAAQAIQTYMLMEAKAKADTAELQKRLVLQQFRPCKFYPVLIYHDGFRWVCEYAAARSQFQESEGTVACAYGMSPEESMQNFDRLWTGAMDASESDDEDEDEDEDEDGDEDV